MPHDPVTPVHRGRAKRLRKELTEAERRLWHRLRAHRLGGFGFKRQVPIGDYIVDFACPGSKLIVELDGNQHGFDAAMAADRDRTRKLEASGWAVIRFWNHDVMGDINAVCDQIFFAARERSYAVEG